MKRATFSIPELAPCFFAIFIDVLGSGIVLPILTILFTAVHSPILPAGSDVTLRYFYLSLGLLLYPLFMFFGASFMGDLSDVIGRKKVLMASMGGLALGLGLIGVGLKLLFLPLIFIGRAVAGLMSASMPVALATIADLSTEENKATHMSYVALVQGLAFIAAPFLGGILSDHALNRALSFSFPLFMASVLAVIAILWIGFFFIDTLVIGERKEIKLKKFFDLMAKAYHHRAIRLLSIAMLLMQTAIGLYLQQMRIFYEIKLNYSILELGIFNTYLGIWFIISLIFVVPRIVKRFKVEKAAIFTLFAIGIAELFSSFTDRVVLLWLLGILLAIAGQSSMTMLFTSFSNAADAQSQGWAMGITGSLRAIASIFSALFSNFIPFLGIKPLIFAGAMMMLIASWVMWMYCKRILPTFEAK